MISTTPKGQAPITKPYTLDNKQPKAKASVKRRCRPSSEYIAMKVSARTPNTVISFIQPCLRTPFAPRACPEDAQLPYCDFQSLSALLASKASLASPRIHQINA